MKKECPKECPICHGNNIIVRDEEKEILVCCDCNLTTRPLKLEER